MSPSRVVDFLLRGEPRSVLRLIRYLALGQGECQIFAVSVWNNGYVIFHPDVEVVADLVADEPDVTSLSLATRLRERFDPDVVAQGLTQAHLRRAAEAKFGSRAHRMWFTRDGLEQASRLSAARYHADVFRAGGVSSLREIGPGIGGDTLAFAEAGITVHGRELDPERVEIARYNLREFPHVSVTCGDGLADITEDGMWADPARRGPRGRISHPEHWSPPLSDVLAAAKGRKLAGIKVAPGIADEFLPSDARVDWISEGGDLLEAVMWIGCPPGRRAVLLGGETLDIPGDPSRRQAPVEPIDLDSYLYEPDPAVIRADGIGTLCTEYGLAPIAPGIAYLTGSYVSSPVMTVFEVLDVLPLNAKKVSSYLAAHNIGRVEIKKRGVDVSPEQFRAQLKLKGRDPITLILSPTTHGRKTIACRRVVLH